MAFFADSVTPDPALSLLKWNFFLQFLPEGV
jgi:hypothetical protein